MLPFGLTSTLATFQCLMEQVLHGLHCKMLLLCLNGAVVIFQDFDRHLQRLEKVFKWLQDAGMKLKLTKCKLLPDEFHCLDYVASAKGVVTDQAKVEAIQK